jgi:hypothetical protein
MTLPVASCSSTSVLGLRDKAAAIDCVAAVTACATDPDKFPGPRITLGVARPERRFSASPLAGIVARFLPLATVNTDDAAVPPAVLAPPCVQEGYFGATVVDGTVYVASKFKILPDGMFAHFDGEVKLLPSSFNEHFNSGKGGVIVNTFTRCGAAGSFHFGTGSSRVPIRIAAIAPSDGGVDHIAILDGARVLSTPDGRKVTLDDPVPRCKLPSSQAGPTRCDKPARYRDPGWIVEVAARPQDGLIAILWFYFNANRRSRDDEDEDEDERPRIVVCESGNGRAVSSFARPDQLDDIGGFPFGVKRDFSSITFSHCGQFLLASYTKTQRVLVFTATTGEYVRSIDVAAAVAAATAAGRCDGARLSRYPGTLVCTAHELVFLDKKCKSIFLLDFDAGFFVGKLSLTEATIARTSPGVRHVLGDGDGADNAAHDNMLGMASILVSDGCVFGIAATGFVYVWRAA